MSEAQLMWDIGGCWVAVTEGGIERRKARLMRCRMSTPQKYIEPMCE
jgi:hypothetical protein